MKVTVYSKPNCVACDATKRYLTDKGIEFDVVDVMADEQASQHVKDLGAQGMPVITAGGHEPIFGFRPDQLTKLVQND